MIVSFDNIVSGGTTNSVGTARLVEPVRHVSCLEGTIVVFSV